MSRPLQHWTLLLSVTAALLAGCTGDLLAPSGSPPRLYRLTAPSRIETTATAAHWQLSVEEPGATQALNTSRIAITPEPDRIDYYANVAWADRAPTMVQALMLESFDKSGKIPAVQREGGGVRADFVLLTDLRDFEADAAGGSTVRVTLAARLVRTRDRTIVASRDFAATAPAGMSFDGTIAGFDQALQTVLAQLSNWTLIQGNANP